MAYDGTLAALCMAEVGRDREDVASLHPMLVNLRDRLRERYGEVAGLPYLAPGEGKGS